jgi:hypothetical protein
MSEPKPSAELRIGDVPMQCGKCGAIVKVYDCEPDVDGEGSLGCSVPDCGGLMQIPGPPEPPRNPKDRMVS